MQLIPNCALENGLCNPNEVLQTFVNFTRILLGFVGAAVLLMFIWGGFKWLTSHGNLEDIKKGQAIVVNALIGLVIVFGAYTAVQFIFTSFQARQGFRIGQECEEGSKRGINVIDPANPRGHPVCVTACPQPPLDGFQCMDPAAGASCIFGLCSDPAKGCCKTGS